MPIIYPFYPLNSLPRVVPLHSPSYPSPSSFYLLPPLYPLHIFHALPPFHVLPDQDIYYISVLPPHLISVINNTTISLHSMYYFISVIRGSIIFLLSTSISSSTIIYPLHFLRTSFIIFILLLRICNISIFTKLYIHQFQVKLLLHIFAFNYPHPTLLQRYILPYIF